MTTVKLDELLRVIANALTASAGWDSTGPSCSWWTRTSEYLCGAAMREVLPDERTRLSSLDEALGNQPAAGR
jgi:hypothetical protein